MEQTLTQQSCSLQRRTYSQNTVRSLFDSIAYRYDILNHTLSFGFDILWRKRAISFLRDIHPNTLLDIATGTGDCAIEAAYHTSASIIGIDISPNMLSRAQQKVTKLSLNHRISFCLGSAEALPFADSSFDAIIVAFGVRNFENLQQGLQEMARVLTRRGSAIILEFSRPSIVPVKQLYNLYSTWWIPTLGGFIARNKSAYTYLPSTIAEFPSGKDFCSILEQSGFCRIHAIPLTFGIATLYIAKKQ